MQYTRDNNSRSICRFPPQSAAVTSRLLALLMLLTATLAPAEQPKIGTLGDTHPRPVASVVANSNKPSVVKLAVPIKRIEQGTRRAFIENCTAFAVSRTDEHHLFLSSWHCVDGLQNRLHTPEITHAGSTVASELKETGGSMREDWLLMTAPSHAFAETIIPTPLSGEPVKLGERLYGFGWGGHRKAQLTSPKALPCIALEVGPRLTLDCVFSKGDSGGLIAREKNGAYEAVGIISAGDSTSTTFAYPTSSLPKQVLDELQHRRE